MVTCTQYCLASYGEEENQQPFLPLVPPHLLLWRGQYSLPESPGMCGSPQRSLADQHGAGLGSLAMKELTTQFYETFVGILSRGGG